VGLSDFDSNPHLVYYLGPRRLQPPRKAREGQIKPDCHRLPFSNFLEHRATSFLHVQKMFPSLLTFWLALVVIHIAFVSGTTTCYNNTGSPVPNMRVCDPDSNISTCCNLADFCLSNGLCLNAGANQMIEIQGCTDRTWASPCQRYCGLGGKYFITAVS